MASIRDIAEQTGLSIATVSRVLNGKGNFSEKTRSRVHACAEALHYVPNEVARSLNTGLNRLIGLLIPSVATPFFAQLTYAIEHAAFQHGYKVLICNSEIDPQIETSYIQMLNRNQVAGIIMASQNENTETYQSVASPLVLIERSFSSQFSSIVSDNYGGGIIATELLIQKGCRCLGHIAGSRSIKPALRRTDAFVETAKKHGVPYLIKSEKAGCNTAAIAEAMLRERPQIDGVFCSSDDEAIALMMVANKHKINIPGQLKIVGFDGIQIALDLGITTIRQPIERIGQQAFRMLLEQIEQKNPAIRHEVLPVQLQEGLTT